MIKHEVLCNQQVYASTADIKKIIQDIFKKISNCYNWTRTNISDTTDDISQIYGAFFFSENACIQIRFSQIDSYDYKVYAFNIIVDTVIIGKGTTTLMTGNTDSKAKIGRLQQQRQITDQLYACGMRLEILEILTIIISLQVMLLILMAR